MSTLKVNKIRDNSGSTDAIVFDPNGGAVLAGVTTVSTVKVGSGVTISSDGDVFTTGITTSSSVIVGGGVTISESGIEASGIGITVANINGGAVSGRRNMIINGDQRVAQRGTTAKLTTTTATYKCVDRFKTDIDGSSGGDFFHAQTGTGTTISADVPTGQGFTHSSKITVNTSVSQPSGTSNRHQFYTQLEKQDVYHLEWGTSTAKICTLSFWVKSSVTGTYTAYIRHYGGTTQSYYTNYTINSANTWEKKVITVTGPTSGGNVNGTTANGILIEFTLGTSSGNETGTLNVWTSSTTIRAAAGSVYLPENAGATWYVTGIQFEIGSQATPFEHLSFGEQLSLCHRYFFNIQGSTGYRTGISCYANSSSTCRGVVYFPAPMRANPTFTGSATAMVFDSAADSASFNVNTISSAAANTNDLYNRAFLEVSTSSMTAGQAGQLEFRASDGFMNFDAEL